MMVAVPIDHLLVSSDIGVVEYEVGPNTGSNHRPLFAVIRLREPSE